MKKCTESWGFHFAFIKPSSCGMYSKQQDLEWKANEMDPPICCVSCIQSMNLSVPEFLSEARSDHRVEPGALGGKGVLEALGHPVLVSLFLSPVSVMNAWEGKMCNREEEREGTVIY